MSVPRTLALLAVLALAPVTGAKAAWELTSCKNFFGVFVSYETERGPRRAGDGATAFSYFVVIRNSIESRPVWVTFSHPGAENAAQRRGVQLPSHNATRVHLGTVWGAELDRATVDRATEVLCHTN